jgi:hypothetical protein
MTRARRPNPRFYNEDNAEFVQGSSRLGVAQLLAAAEIPGVTIQRIIALDLSLFVRSCLEVFCSLT